MVNNLRYPAALTEGCLDRRSRVGSGLRVSIQTSKLGKKFLTGQGGSRAKALARVALSRHYAAELGEPFVTVGMCLYRDGRDSVAWHGDLLVMGGSCQRTWDHAVPKTSAAVGPRISIQFRVRGVR